MEHLTGCRVELVVALVFHDKMDDGEYRVDIEEQAALRGENQR